MGGNHTELEVWKVSMHLTEKVYRATTNFPDAERFGLSVQMRRTAVSIASNIAEGRGRRSPREFRRFLDIAYGSLFELETQLDLSERLGYLSDENSRELDQLASSTGRLLNGLRRSLIPMSGR